MANGASVWDLAATVAELFDTRDRPAADFAGVAGEFLREFGDNPDQCSAAFAHPLGFTVFRWSITARTALRFHVWQAGNRDVDHAVDHRHDHLWRLASHVLVGRLIEHELQLADVPDGEGEIWELADILQEADADTVRPTGRLVRIAADRPAVVRAGESYGLAPGEFHWTEPVGTEMVATIVRSTAELDRPPRTIVRPGSSGRPRRQRREIEAGQRKAVVESVVAAMRLD